MREVAGTNEDVKIHLRESELMQKQWFTYVLDVVEKMHSRVEANALQLQKEREQIFRELVSLRDKLNDKISEVSKEQSEELKQLDTKLADFIESTRINFSETSDHVSVSIKELDGKQGKNLCALENKLRDELAILISKQHKENIKFDQGLGDLVTGQAVINTKLAVYVALISLGTTTVLGVLATSVLFVFKDALKAWLG